MQIYGNEILETCELGFHERMDLITLKEVNKEIILPKIISRSELEKMERQCLKISKSLLAIAHHTRLQMEAGILCYQLLVEKEESNEHSIFN